MFINAKTGQEKPMWRHLLLLVGTLSERSKLMKKDFFCLKFVVQLPLTDISKLFRQMHVELN